MDSEMCNSSFVKCDIKHLEYKPTNRDLSILGSANDLLKPQHAFRNRTVDISSTEGF